MQARPAQFLIPPDATRDDLPRWLAGFAERRENRGALTHWETLPARPARGAHMPCDVQNRIVQPFSNSPSVLSTENRALAASRTQILPSRAIAMPSAFLNSPGPPPLRPITRTSAPSGANMRMSCVFWS